MSPYIESVGQATVADDFGGALTAESDLGSDRRWPWALAMLGAAVVALGALAFSPDSDNGNNPCAHTICATPSGDPAHSR